VSQSMWSIVAMALLSVAGLAAHGARIESAEVGNVFLEGRRVILRVAGVEGAAGAWQVRVVSFGGQMVAERAAQSGEPVNLGALPTGYYDVTAVGPDNRVLTAPVVVVGRTRPAARSPVGVDAAHAWLLKPDQLDAGARLIRLAGVSWVRERIRWGEVEPEPGVYRWQRYDRAVDAARPHGLRVVQVFHDSPAWSRADRDTARFPDDPRDAYRFGRAAAEHFRGRVAAWEVWNEADIPAFSVEPASEYAWFLKAVQRGLKAGDPRVPVAQVSYALKADRFADLLYRNDAAGYFDVFNYHIYAAPSAYPERAQGHFDALDRYGIAGMPVWVTEAGVPLVVRSGLTQEQKRRQAEFIPKSYALSLASGTDRHFFFVFPHYVENGSWFGLLDPEMRPYPGYAALATVGRMLGNTRYAGRILDPTSPRLERHVFVSAREQVVVVWSDGDAVQLPLTASISPVRVVDCVGAEVPVTPGANRVLNVGSSPLYLVYSRGSVSADGSRLASRRSPGRRSVVGLPDVIVRWMLPKEAVRKSRELYELAAGVPLPVKVQVTNLGARALRGRLEIRAEGAEPSSTVVPVHVPAMGAESFTVSLAVQAVGKGSVAQWSARVVDAGGRRSSARAVVDVSVDPASLGVGTEAPVPVAAGAVWEQNASPSAAAQVTGDPHAGAISLRVRFQGDGDRWCRIASREKLTMRLSLPHEKM